MNEYTSTQPTFRENLRIAWGNPKLSRALDIAFHTGMFAIAVSIAVPALALAVPAVAALITGLVGPAAAAVVAGLLIHSAFAAVGILTLFYKNLFNKKWRPWPWNKNKEPFLDPAIKGTVFNLRRWAPWNKEPFLIPAHEAHSPGKKRFHNFLLIAGAAVAIGIIIFEPYHNIPLEHGLLAASVLIDAIPVGMAAIKTIGRRLGWYKELKLEKAGAPHYKRLLAVNLHAPSPLMGFYTSPVGFSEFQTFKQETKFMLGHNMDRDAFKNAHSLHEDYPKVDAKYKWEIVTERGVLELDYDYEKGTIRSGPMFNMMYSKLEPKEVLAYSMRVVLHSICGLVTKDRLITIEAGTENEKTLIPLEGSPSLNIRGSEDITSITALICDGLDYPYNTRVDFKPSKKHVKLVKQFNASLKTQGILVEHDGKLYLDQAKLNIIPVKEMSVQKLRGGPAPAA